MDVLQPLTPEWAEEIASWVETRADVVLFAGPLAPWPFTAAALTEAADAAWQVLVLTDADGVPVATASVIAKHDGRSLQIGRVLVDPARRGQGWGRRLMEALLDRADADPRVLATELGVYTHNVAARTLYEWLGFLPTGDTRTTDIDGEQWQAIEMVRLRP